MQRATSSFDRELEMLARNGQGSRGQTRSLRDQHTPKVESAAAGDEPAAPLLLAGRRRYLL